jgi:predicted nucleic acid-binding protein
VELLDSSVWARRRHPRIRDWFDSAVAAGDVAVCDLVALELLAGTARADFESIATALEGFPWISMTAGDWRRAREVQRLLARAGAQLHRMVRVTDLLIAAAAEREGVPLVHYDRDFDAIAAVTGQAARWVAAQGSAG